ncbi:MAG: hypothetical protein H8D45_11800 [Bacteroidetes bacterium]|nr:hypothetical protein [Bacteroidota bacterium]MBL7103515.1 hypothetical protein [Bacteroidales bacterium]
MQKYNIGIYSHTAEMPEGFDIYFNYLKDVTGKINKPVEHSHNIISCFADNKTAKQHPESVPYSGKSRAIQSEDKTLYCDWICRSHNEYCLSLFELIKETDKSNVAGIHLDSVSMPGFDYCICDKCLTKMKDGNLSFNEFRMDETTSFVKQISEITTKQLSLTLYPDPFYQERHGLNIDALSKYIDFFLIPLYDINYESLYWLEILAHGFSKRLKNSFYIMLYAQGVDLENLKNAARLISNYTNNIIISYDNDKAAEINKMLKKV